MSSANWAILSRPQCVKKQNQNDRLDMFMNDGAVVCNILHRLSSQASYETSVRSMVDKKKMRYKSMAQCKTGKSTGL